MGMYQYSLYIILRTTLYSAESLTFFFTTQLCVFTNVIWDCTARNGNVGFFPKTLHNIKGGGLRLRRLSGKSDYPPSRHKRDLSRP